MRRRQFLQLVASAVALPALPEFPIEEKQEIIALEFYGESAWLNASLEFSRFWNEGWRRLYLPKEKIPNLRPANVNRE